MPERKQYPITIIVTHPNMHSDEHFAIWMLRKFGEELFPGVGEAFISFWNDEYKATNNKDGRTREDWLNEGTLLVGVGGDEKSFFDEHPSEGERKGNDCAATLVAKYLGIDKMPELQRDLEYIFASDTNRVRAQWGDKTYSVLVKTMHGEVDDLEVLEFLSKMFDAIFAKQVDFHSAHEDFEDNGSTVEVIHKGQPTSVVFVESDKTKMHSWCFSQLKAGVCVVKRSNGQVQIFRHENQRKGRRPIDLRKTLRVIRMAELAYRSKSYEDVADLEAENCTEVPNWVYPNQNMILNGALSHPEVEPTVIPWDKLQEFVARALDEGKK